MGRPAEPHSTWTTRARVARGALVDQYWDDRRRLFRVEPGLLGRVRGSVPGSPWHYWWQAHALECLLDGAENGDSGLTRIVPRLLDGIPRRIRGSITANDYFDDLAWMGLAAWRAHRLGLIGPELPLRLADAVLQGHDQELGGFRWRVGDSYHNVAASAPAAMLLARTDDLVADGRLRLAMETADWLHKHVVHPSGLVWDGARLRGEVMEPEGPIWSYTFGVVAGLDLVLAECITDGVRAAHFVDRALRVLRVGTWALRSGHTDVHAAAVALEVVRRLPVIPPSQPPAANPTTADRLQSSPGTSPVGRFAGTSGMDGAWLEGSGDAIGDDPLLFPGILAQQVAAAVVARPGSTEDLAADLRRQAEFVWAGRDAMGRLSTPGSRAATGDGTTAVERGPTGIAITSLRRRPRPVLASHLSGTLLLGAAARLDLIPGANQPPAS